MTRPDSQGTLVKIRPALTSDSFRPRGEKSLGTRKRRSKGTKVLRTVEEKKAIVDEYVRRRTEGLEIGVMLRRERLHFGQVTDWKRQIEDGTIVQKTRLPAARRAVSAPVSALSTPPVSPGLGKTLVESVDKLVKDNASLKGALITIRANLIQALGRAA